MHALCKRMNARKEGKVVRERIGSAANQVICRIPPPKSFLNHRALVIKAFGPTKHVPIGAPVEQLKSWLKRHEQNLTEALVKAQADGVKGVTNLFQGQSCLDGDVPDPCSVEVHDDVASVRIP